MAPVQGSDDGTAGYGVYGSSSSAAGVEGEVGTFQTVTWAGHGSTKPTPPPAGVVGYGFQVGTAASVAAYGVYGNSLTAGDGVYGVGSGVGSNGVHGYCVGGSGYGVLGVHESGTGVCGMNGSGSGHPQSGQGVQAAGVWGDSALGNGVYGSSADMSGVEGDSWSAESGGVTGRNNAGGPGIVAASQSGVGLQAQSTSGNAISASSSGDTDAIAVTTSSPNHAAVSCNNSGGGYGVWASSTNSGGQGGIGVYATGALHAAQFDGHVQVVGELGVISGSAPYAIDSVGPSRFNGDITVSGNVTAGDVLLPGSDCAEDFDVVSAVDVDPGTVMVLTENGSLQTSQNAYDKKVAGVISGAGAYRPGLVLGRCQSSEGRMPLALAGKVYCKADAQYGPIEVGDLLTTSPTTGHAMRAVDPMKAFGAVIGKALQPLRSGQGLVSILVALQ